MRRPLTNNAVSSIWFNQSAIAHITTKACIILLGADVDCRRVDFRQPWRGRGITEHPTDVGLVTLVGLIGKHAILIVEFANNLQRSGVSKRRAIEQAAGIRLPPILMTTAAMVLGVVP